MPIPDESDRARAGTQPSLGTMVQRSAIWIAHHELWLLGIAAPFFLFPSRWTWAALLLILLPWLSRLLTTGKLTTSTGVDMPILLLLCMAVVGFSISPEPATSLTALWRIVLGVAAFYALVNGLQGDARLARLPAILLLFSVLLTLLTWLGTSWDAVRLFHLPQMYERLPRLLRDLQDQNSFHPRVMGMALATIWPLSAALFLFSPHKRYRIWGGVTALAMGLTVALTQSLQAAVGIAGALLFLGICWNGFVWLSVPFLLGVFLFALWHYGMGRVASVLLSPANPLGIAVTLRLDIWSRALAMIYDMPYTGVGLDAFPVVQSNFYPGVMIGPEPHAHQLLLQIALDLGVPGLLAFLWLLLNLSLVAFRAYRRCQNAQQRAILLGTLGSIASYIASGFLDTIWAAKPAVLFWFVLGIAAALCTVDGTPPKRTKWRLLVAFTKHCLPLLFILLIPCLCFGVAHRTPALNQTIVQAHRLLLSAQAGENPSPQRLASVATDLSNVLPLQKDNPYLLGLLGRLYGWLGEYPAAIDTFSKVAALDSQDAVVRYAPFEYLRRRLLGERDHDPLVDTLWIYRNWMARFPQRAEPVLLVALVQERDSGDLQGAAATLQSGIKRGAQPQGLILYYLEQLKQTFRDH